MANAAWTAWFVSVWCYFAALLSVIVCLHLRPHALLPLLPRPA